uniref:RxLR effector candidate protein n=2 Tax=Hyaloperonospora arabidopsidis (strain Emoy2) TaxID=559515 RepID=M4C1G9_HYAAE
MSNLFLLLVLALITFTRCGALSTPSDGQLPKQTMANEDQAPQSEEDGERVLVVPAGSPLSLNARFTWQKVLSEMVEVFAQASNYKPKCDEDEYGKIILGHMRIEREKREKQRKLPLRQAKGPDNGQDNQPAESVDKQKSTMFSRIKKMFTASGQGNARDKGSGEKTKSYVKKRHLDIQRKKTHLRHQDKEPRNPLGKEPGNPLDKEVGKEPGNVSGRMFRESVQASVDKPKPAVVSKTKKDSAVFGQDTDAGKEPVQPVKEPVQPVKEPVRPVKEPVQPVKEPVQPVKEPVQPVKEPVQPVKEPVQPVKEPVQPVQPVKEPVQPVKEPVQPVKEPVQPGKEPVQSVKEPGKNSEASVEGPKPTFASWIKEGVIALKTTIANVITRLWNFLTSWKK